MINLFEVKETNEMIEKENLDVRTITLGISLLDCIDSNLDKLNRKIYDKITTTARNLVSVGEEIEGEFGIPIVNKRISVTPIALVGAAACRTPEDFVTIAQTLDRAAKEVGVNFLGGYSALVSKGMTTADELLIRSIPQALAVTDFVCSSINLGSTKTGINMDFFVIDRVRRHLVFFLFPIECRPCKSILGLQQFFHRVVVHIREADLRAA